jgi:hypothetical protein
MPVRRFESTRDSQTRPVETHEPEVHQSVSRDRAAVGSPPVVAPAGRGRPRPETLAVALGRASGGQLTRAGHALTQLQRQHGNRYFQQVVGIARGRPPDRTVPQVQPKLVVGGADDRYEREADRVAHRVVGRPPAQQQTPGRHRATRHRDVGSALQPAIQQARGGGKPLVSGLRRLMEPAFRADFSDVRVHDDTEADRLSRLLDARAFTTGRDIFLRSGEYRPASREGRALLAHELTHVVQQGRAAACPSGTFTPAPAPVQRLTTAKKFKTKAGLTGRKGKSHQQFQSLTAGLRAYETTGDVRSLMGVRETARQWLASPGAAGSSRRKPVKKLMGQLRTGAADLAKRLIDSSALDNDYKARARVLIGNPDAIDQTEFGVCGMVSILRPVATHDPVRFADIAIRALTDPSLDKVKWKEVFDRGATDKQKGLGAEFDFLVSQWLVRHAAHGNVSQTVLKPAGGSRVPEEKTKSYGEVFKAQHAFSESFGIPDWEDVLGHYATTTGGLNYLLTSVIGGQNSYKIKLHDFAADYDLARTKAGTRGHVIASVKDTDFYQQNGAPVDVPPPAPKPKFRHWVMIDRVERQGDYFVINIWTWAEDFVARVHKDVILDYFYSFVVTSFD